jgi:cell division topological specificity factor
MFNFFKKQKKADPKSKHVAKERLQLVLIHDRASIPPNVIEAIRKDIILAISKHIDIEPGNVSVSIEAHPGQSRNSSSIVADVPLRKKGEATR